MNSDLNLLDTGKTAQDFLRAVERYRGLAYHYHNTFVSYENGVPQGTTNCFGLIFLALRDLKMVAHDFDINLSVQTFHHRRSYTLRQMLNLNCERVNWIDEGLRDGDILLMRWHDVNAALREPHHVAIVCGSGKEMIHALDAESGGHDRINHHRITALDYNRIDEAWRINLLKETSKQ